jgi:hypothetical protein
MPKAPTTKENKPPTVQDAFKNTHPMHQMFGKALENLGGQEFIDTWAEENPSEFVNILIRLTPMPQQTGPASGTEIHIHPGLQAGPLDVVATQDPE